jgi:sensor histidine kinase YesM
MSADLFSVSEEIVLGAKFVFQLLLAVVIYTLPLSRRKHLILRLVILAAVAGVGALFMDLDNRLLPYFSVCTAAFYIWTLVSIYVLFRVSWANALFCWVSACATQFILSQSYVLFEYAFGTFAADIIEICMFVLLYTFCYLFFVKRIKREGIASMNNVRLTTLSAAIWFIADIVCNIGRMFGWETPLSAVYGVGCACLILVIEFGLLREGKIEREKNIVEHLLGQEEEQHRVTKEAIEYINIQNHDLKHEIEGLRALGAGEELEGVIGALEKKLQEYEDIVKTENKTLNIVLTEKNLYAKKYGIKLYYVADGNAVSFMHSGDIFSLFGNMLDNAIECLKKEPPEKRNIDLNVFKKGNMTVVTVENPCSGERDFKDGLPLTTKKESNLHGYGTKSICYIAEKYGGNAVFDFQNGVFNVTVLLPNAGQSGVKA